jgi:hypothetical protein
MPGEIIRMYHQGVEVLTQGGARVGYGDKVAVSRKTMRVFQIRNNVGWQFVRPIDDVGRRTRIINDANFFQLKPSQSRALRKSPVLPIYIIS